MTESIEDAKRRIGRNQMHLLNYKTQRDGFILEDSRRGMPIGDAIRMLNRAKHKYGFIYDERG